MKKIAYIIVIISIIGCWMEPRGSIIKGDKKIIENKSVIDSLIGYYTMSDTKECDLTVLIKKNGNNYSYIFYKGTEPKAHGTIQVTQEEKQTLLKFENSFTAVYSNDTITFQNYGNSMNDYEYIDYCPLKYVTLTKSKTIQKTDLINLEKESKIGIDFKKEEFRKDICQDTLIASIKKGVKFDIVDISLISHNKKLTKKDTIFNPLFNSVSTNKTDQDIGVISYIYGVGNSMEEYRYKINLKKAKFYELLSYSVDQNKLSLTNEKIDVKLKDFSSERLFESQKSKNYISVEIPLNNHVKDGNADIMPYENLIKNLYHKNEISKLKLSCNNDIYNILTQYLKFNDPKYVNSYNNIAYYLEQSKLYDEAIYLLKKIIKNFPNRTVAYMNLGDAHWGLNKKDKAKAAYKIYVKQMKANGKTNKIPNRVLIRIKD